MYVYNIQACTDICSYVYMYMFYYVYSGPFLIWTPSIQPLELSGLERLFNKSVFLEVCILSKFLSVALYIRKCMGRNYPHFSFIQIPVSLDKGGSTVHNYVHICVHSDNYACMHVCVCACICVCMYMCCLAET